MITVHSTSGVTKYNACRQAIQAEDRILQEQQQQPAHQRWSEAVTAVFAGQGCREAANCGKIQMLHDQELGQPGIGSELDLSADLDLATSINLSLEIKACFVPGNAEGANAMYLEGVYNFAALALHLMCHGKNKGVQCKPMPDVGLTVLGAVQARIRVLNDFCSKVQPIVIISHACLQAIMSFCLSLGAWPAAKTSAGLQPSSSLGCRLLHRQLQQAAEPQTLPLCRV